MDKQPLSFKQKLAWQAVGFAIGIGLLFLTGVATP